MGGLHGAGPSWGSVDPKVGTIRVRDQWDVADVQQQVEACRTDWKQRVAIGWPMGGQGKDNGKTTRELGTIGGIYYPI